MRYLRGFEVVVRLGVDVSGPQRWNMWRVELVPSAVAPPVHRRLFFATATATAGAEKTRGAGDRYYLISSPSFV